MVMVGEWLAHLDELYPPSWAETWDNPGLQVGDRSSQVTEVLVALDPTVEVIREAADKGAQLLVTHHPLVLEPLVSLDVSRPTESAIAEALSVGVAVIACHTNADVASPGVSDALAWSLGISVEGPLSVATFGGKVKLTTFVPPESSHHVLEALAKAGAGTIGEYDVCSFRVLGTATFRPSGRATPSKGKKRVVNEVEEERLEMIVPRERLQGAMSALIDVHPYEEPAIDVAALEDVDGELGLGRVGELTEETTSSGLLALCRERLGGAPRMVGSSERAVSRVAVCGGSGASLVPEAVKAAVDAFVTGDVRHHAALDALATGMLVIDAGHHASEWPWVPHLAARLSEFDAGSEVSVSEVRTDPFEEPS